MAKSPIFVKYHCILKKDKSAFTLDDFNELNDYLYKDPNNTGANLLFIRGQQALQIRGLDNVYENADEFFEKYHLYEWMIVSNPVRYSDIDLEDVKLEDVKNGV